MYGANARPTLSTKLAIEWSRSGSGGGSQKVKSTPCEKLSSELLQCIQLVWDATPLTGSCINTPLPQHAAEITVGPASLVYWQPNNFLLDRATPISSPNESLGANYDGHKASRSL